MSSPRYQIGSLVRARGREWVVLPSETPDVMMLRPLSGGEDEVCGIYAPLEGHSLEDAAFPNPAPIEGGDFLGGSLLRDAARLTLRSSAAPLRSFGRISVRPRPYQLVPLIMALRLDPVRMLIADDVGIGKTIEAGLIARELLERGEIRRICVLCPPHLCDQWQRELATKFQIRAVIVRTNTIARLERDLPRADASIYRHYRHLVVSIDFAKGARRRDQFLADCPEFVIVDEVHTAAQPGGIASSSQQQRHELVHRVAADQNRHLALLTATPHSGLEESFRSLLGLVDPEYEQWSVSALNESQRRHLARHLVQRLRADVRRWLGPETSFPDRKPEDVPYNLSEEYLRLFEDILAFTRETVYEEGLSQRRQRVRYWAALSLLRCVMSSPAAGVAALRKAAGRADKTGAEPDEEVADEVRQWEVMDPIREEGANDTVPDSAVAAGDRDLADSERRRLQAFARRAEGVARGDADLKVEKASELVATLIRKGYRPIVYCRFIQTAKYVAEQLQERLQREFSDLHALAVTSETGSDEERETRVGELAESTRRVLVATDCLSEGVNLQDHFDAVLHYDLPWNPNRLEQREGRVDRFGQQAPVVPVYLLYGAQNQIDLKVLEVLIRKAREIFRSTGVRTPVPVESETVMEALTRALFQQPSDRRGQLRLEMEEVEQQRIEAMLTRWGRAAELEKESRTRFAQHAIRPDEVAQELDATDVAVGDPAVVRTFFLNAAQRLEISVQTRNGYSVIDPASLDGHLRAYLGWRKPKRVAFDSPPPKAAEDADILDRNHPLITAVSDRILSEAFAPSGRGDRPFSRCGAAFSAEVNRRTAILLLRLRYRMRMRRDEELFGEEVVVAGFRGAGTEVEWLGTNGEEVLALLQSSPTSNISPEERVHQVEWALGIVGRSTDELRKLKDARAAEIEASHDRVRSQLRGRKTRVTAYDPDILGIYVLVPGARR